jgi:hypothetical protein
MPKTPCKYCGFEVQQSDEDCPAVQYKYVPLYRPPGFATVPSGWVLVERPRQSCGFDRRTDLPLSEHQFGVIGYAKRLPVADVDAFQLKPL